MTNQGTICVTEALNTCWTQSEATRGRWKIAMIPLTLQVRRLMNAWPYTFVFQCISSYWCNNLIFAYIIINCSKLLSTGANKLWHPGKALIFTQKQLTISCANSSYLTVNQISEYSGQSVGENKSFVGFRKVLMSIFHYTLASWKHFTSHPRSFFFSSVHSDWWGEPGIWPGQDHRPGHTFHLVR